MVKITFLPDLSCVRDGEVQRGVGQPEPGRDGDGQVGDPEELRQGRNLLSNSQRRQHLAKSYARCNKTFYFILYEGINGNKVQHFYFKEKIK